MLKKILSLYNQKESWVMIASSLSVVLETEV